MLASKVGTVFHTTHWLDASGLPYRIYAVFENGVIAGGFVAPYRLKRGLGPVFARPPQTPYCGMLVFLPDQKRTTAYTHYKEIAALLIAAVQTDFAQIHVRLAPSIQDLQPFIWAGFQPGVRYTYIVDLTDLDVTWQNMDKKRRNDITNAQKKGLKVVADVPLLDCLGVFKATREDPGDLHALIQSYDKLLSSEKLARTFGVYDTAGELLSSLYLVWDHQRSYYLLGGYLEDLPDELGSRGASTLALWEAMRCTRLELGLSQFDLEGSMMPGVERFFRQFGGALLPYYTVSWSAPRARQHQIWNSATRQVKHWLGLSSRKR